MNDWQANRAAALEILASLSPDAYKARYSELLRGGLSASSIPEGSRSSEKPLPGFDNTDVNLQRDERNYSADWVELLKVCRRLESYENALKLIMGVDVPPKPKPDDDREVWRAYNRRMAEAISKAVELLTDEEQGEHRFVCRHCGKTFKRTANQRPKSGRCHACFTYWVRHARLEDAPLTERRKDERVG